MRQNIRKIELLAPAKNADIAIEAIKHGADAVYMGASAFGARAAAGNSIDDIAAVTEFAHKFNARVYATVNTIIYDNELKEVENLIKRIYHSGVDAIIIQDMGILRLDIPPIELHASTQCDIRTPEKAKFLESLGFAQLVLARELSAKEISDIHNTVTVPLESFVHGALCVSYSGRCEISQVLKKRSANRGECAQICRLPFDLIDEKGNVIIANKHLLSLRDFNQSERIGKLLEAGVSSFKIEGRLKDVNYVKNVVAYYRQKIDTIIAANPQKYIRSSTGKTELTFTPNLYKSFNRSFTHYFFDKRELNNGDKIASIHTPKSQGEPIGTVCSCKNNKIYINNNAKSKLHNGDGFSYLSQTYEYCGFRANSVKNDEITTFNPINIRTGSKLYRTFDNDFDNLMHKNTAERYIDISCKLTYINTYLYLEISDCRGNNVMTSLYVGNLEYAKTSQHDRQIAVLSKVGNTIYRLKSATVVDGLFIPSSILTQLRRDAINILDANQRISYAYKYREAEKYDTQCYTNSLIYSDNVANNMAKNVYMSHGVISIEPAIEVEDREISKKAVMHTRYCIRRELGACKKDRNALKHLPEKIYLKYGKDTILEVMCDCKNCEMKIYIND